jgi:hypothetical protein
LAQIGDLSGVINAVGPYITGDFIDPDDVTDMTEVLDDGRKVHIEMLSLHTHRVFTTTHNVFMMVFWYFILYV